MSMHAHHFESPEQQQLAETMGLWVFLVTEVMFFGALFTTYAVYRYLYPQAFIEASRALDLTLGAVNTAVLLCSSLTMALAVHGVQTRAKTGVVIYLILTVLLGSVFLGIKGVEYYHKYQHHLIPGHNFFVPSPEANHVALFMSLYFVMTGVHALHMIIGLGIILVLVARTLFASQEGLPTTGVELTGLYWHFVDIVWVFLFPLLYLIDRT
jgi:cytochrome c oxidase subunit 3